MEAVLISLMALVLLLVGALALMAVHKLVTTDR
jgi:hypothetical protein